MDPAVAAGGRGLMVHIASPGVRRGGDVDHRRQFIEPVSDPAGDIPLSRHLADQFMAALPQRGTQAVETVDHLTNNTGRFLLREIMPHQFDAPAGPLPGE